MLDHATRLGWTLPAKNLVVPNLIAEQDPLGPATHPTNPAIDGCSNITEFVFVGRLEPRKGLDIMVGAIEKLAAMSSSNIKNSNRSESLSHTTFSFLGRTVSDPARGDTASWIHDQHRRHGWGGAKVRKLVSSCKLTSESHNGRIIVSTCRCVCLNHSS